MAERTKQSEQSKRDQNDPRRPMSLGDICFLILVADGIGSLCLAIFPKFDLHVNYWDAYFVCFFAIALFIFGRAVRFHREYECARRARVGNKTKVFVFGSGTRRLIRTLLHLVVLAVAFGILEVLPKH